MHPSCFPPRWLALALAAAVPARAAMITCPPAVIETPVVSSLLNGWDVEVRAGRRALSGASLLVSRGSDRRSAAPDFTSVAGRRETPFWTIAPADGEIWWVACSYGNTSALMLQRVPDGVRRCVARGDVGAVECD